MICDEEEAAVLYAGLLSAPFITVDDTGAKHPRRDGIIHISREFGGGGAVDQDGLRICYEGPVIASIAPSRQCAINDGILCACATLHWSSAATVLCK
ncbi:hypothetical protein C5750_10345 [Phyllobacterium myrsinacearum]|uniref:Uncharacterized protein n=1 Tax=Phyllobacterium myrsinacearum TaxID=28101 RepID=A0A2S9JQL7_9HYPH|nr:hypothetical protein C5750_10345 [Phyllobacterium myrsinacearum]